MKVQSFRSAGLVALSCSMVLLAGRFTAGNAQIVCVDSYLGDGDCDANNNNEDCGYDGGDCCQETCVDGTYVCGSNGGFDCTDPEHSDDPEMSFDFSFSFSFECLDDKITNFFCNPSNNNERCGYDGGDCCDCTCPRDFFNAPCGGQGGNTCFDPNAPCIDGFVEAGTLTTVTTSANGFDARPGTASGGNGCMDDGCMAELTRDGDVDDAESRWSCRQSLVSDGSLCAITFSFEEPQDIEYVQVAFYKADERFRSLQVTSNGVDMGKFESLAESNSAFTGFGLRDNAVETLTLTTSGLGAREWISLLEVRFMVENPDM